jgi:hypothetical protein
MYVFNGGRGAVICDYCRTIINENVYPYPPSQQFDVCDECEKFPGKWERFIPDEPLQIFGVLSSFLEFHFQKGL